MAKAAGAGIMCGLAALLVLVDAAEAWSAEPADGAPNQYEHEQIVIPPAHAAEEVRAAFSIERAADYLERGAVAWSKSRNCVACHTNGSYLVIRPALTPQLGQPSTATREFFVDVLEKHRQAERETLLSGIRPTQMAYLAAGLAEWDAHVSGTVSPETDAALRLMFEVQSDDGSWGNADCWPPFESSAYQGATVAAMAAATAPGWLAGIDDEQILAGVERLKNYLKNQTPPHDYARLLLLWSSTRMAGIIDEAQRKELIDMIWTHQREDGGWSIRTFADPEAWGRGSRAEKLRAEPEFSNPPSDGHQTGLSIVVLRDAGVSADDPRIRRGVDWLLTNQRESGRWWTRSLNTDKHHFITYSGTCYPLLALAKCDALPTVTTKAGAD